MKLIMKDSSKASKHENEYDYAVQVTRVIMQMIGAWPIPSSASIVSRIAVRLQNVICYFLFAFNIVPGLLLIYLKERDFKRRAKLVAPILNSWMNLMKYSLLLFHAREIRSCLKQVRQDWKDTVDWQNRKMMLSKAKIGRKFVIYSAAFMYIGGLSYRTILPLSKGRMLTPMNTTVRALACPSYFVKFDEQASPAYEIVFTLQFFAGLLTYSITVAGTGLAAFFVMHVCGQLRILMSKLQRLNDIPESKDRAITILLADIVEHQIKVKNFLEQVEEAMRYVWLVEITGCTLVLCFTGYYIILAWESNDSTGILTFTVILISFTFSIYVNCYVGQLLTNQGFELGLMTSTMNWYRLPYKKARTLILIMAISNTPAKISAGNIVEMSLPTFSNIIKTSVAYFNLLRNTIIS